MWKRASDNTKNTSRKKIFLGVVAILILLGALTGGFLYGKHRATPVDSGAAQTETNKILAEVSKIYMLPTSEVPTVARVEDKSKLAGQVFFKDVKNGDYVLVYNKTKIALLYRQKEGKLINVGPISTSGETAGAATGQTPDSSQP